MKYTKFIDKNSKDILNISSDTADYQNVAFGETAFNSYGYQFIGRNKSLTGTYFERKVSPNTLYPYQFQNQPIKIALFNGITNEGIPEGVCQGCSELKRVQIRPANTFISSYAFQNCINLSLINIIQYATECGSYAFDTTSLSGNMSHLDRLSKIDECCFRNTKITGFSASLLTSIGCKAFVGCSNLSYVYTSRARLSSYLFANCSNLQSVSIIFRDATNIIPDFCFSGCKKLTTINGQKTRYSRL